MKISSGFGPNRPLVVISNAAIQPAIAGIHALPQISRSVTRTKTPDHQANAAPTAHE